METIVVVFVFALLALTVVQLLTGGIRAWRKGQTKSTLRAAARTAVDQISAELRQASSVAIPGGFLKSSELYFDRPAASSLGLTTDNVSYTISGTQLIRKGSDNQEVVIAENVVSSQSYFLRTSADGRSWRIVITTAEEGSTSSDIERVTLGTSVYLQANQSSTIGGTETVRDLAVPTSIADPRSVPFRHPTLAGGVLKADPGPTIIP